MTGSMERAAPARAGLAGELLQRMADAMDDDTLYRDGTQPATDRPAAMPAGLHAFAEDALRRLIAEPGAIALALGEVMTEPKPSTWFDEPASPWVPAALRLDRRTRMMYDDRHVFINGEGFRAAGADARLMQRLADRRRLDRADVTRASPQARALLQDWHGAGWLHTDTDS